MQVEPLIYTQATEEQRRLLKELYEVEPFAVKTIKLERIFADKLLAAEFYYQRNLLFDVSKHLYDIAVMMEQERIQKLISENERFIEMISYKRIEEQERIGSDLAAKPFCKFSLFNNLSSDSHLQKKFILMQNIYVFDEKDKMEYKKLLVELGQLYKVLINLDEGLEQRQENVQAMKIE